ncbi:MAG: hypothetical protein H3C47_14420 [Candidatus Cloacimonetes bacterium]|nr:hypothetical protein [Candidatus Cloacimonadota bacterium]
MKLLSDTAFAAGSGYGNQIDSDVVLDTFGLPVIPARRVKGLLLDAGSQLTTALGDLYQQKLAATFGVGGQAISDSASFDNGKLQQHEELRQWLEYLKQKKSEWFTQDSVASEFTVIRRSTALDDEGTAKKNSLRTIRMLRKGQIFNFSVFCTVEQAEIVSLAALALRQGGSSRNRGSGQITCKLLDSTGKDIADEAIQHWFKESK